MIKYQTPYERRKAAQADIDAAEARAALFKERLKVLGLGTVAAARELAVSRYAVMHWKAGRRAIPPMVDVVLSNLAQKKFKDFFE